MNCPRCEENSLSFIRFKDSGKTAYLCSTCNIFWLENEPVKITNGHLLEAGRDDLHSENTYEYMDEKEKENREITDIREREEHEIF